MKTLFLITLTLCLTMPFCFAQGENNIWAFGYGNGIDFSSGSPSPYGTALYTLEGSAAVCGKSGNLKFYSDGQRVFNKWHNPMPNGSGLMTDLSMTQGVAILPFVDDTNQYYLFVLHREDEISKVNILNYSVVDMRLDGGRGDIVGGRKNIRIDSFLSEKMFVTRASGCNYWLMVHGRGPQFHAFKITASGVHTTPVISTTPYAGDGNFGIGEMKVSQANNQIVLANWRSKGTLGSIELFDFDSTTGKVGNYRLIDSSYKTAAYGIEFSPDGKKIYAAYGEDDPRPPYSLIQYNIGLLPDIALVRDTKTELATAFNWGGMRRYRGKIYVIKYPGSVCTINNPDNPGLSCNFDPANIFGANALKAGFSLGNPVPETLPVTRRATDTAICTRITYSGAAGFAHYAWSDGDTSASKTVTPPQTVWVKATNSSCGAVTIDTFHVRQTSLSADLGPALVLCRDKQTTLDAKVPDASYLWSNGSSNKSIFVEQSGTYWVTISRGDCISSDTVLVRLGDCTRCITIPNTFTPNADGRNDVFHTLSSCPVLRYSLQIYNRYGQELFATADPLQGWDGRFNGVEAEVGVYFYLVKVFFDKPDAGEELYKGDISLLR